MRLGQTDDGTDPKCTTQRQAYDLIAEGFGPGANGPLVLAVSLPKAGDTAPADAVQQAVAKVPGVRVDAAAGQPGRQNAAVHRRHPAVGARLEQTAELVDELRARRAADSGRGHGCRGLRRRRHRRRSSTWATGSRTVCCCSSAPSSLLSFVLLMMVFRSVLVPLKAAVMNLLSIGAAYGVIVAVFQWGWAKGLVGLEQTVPDRGVRADDDVRHPLRAVDGLRGVPALADPRGVPAARSDNLDSVVDGPRVARPG